MTHPQKPWFLYLIRCGDNSLYTGITVDLERRLAEHQAQGKQCAKYLKGKAPLELVFSTPAGHSKSEASRLEYRVKRLSKRNKERLVAGQISLRGCLRIWPNVKFETSTIKETSKLH